MIRVLVRKIMKFGLAAIVTSGLFVWQGGWWHLAPEYEFYTGNIENYGAHGFPGELFTVIDDLDPPLFQARISNVYHFIDSRTGHTALAIPVPNEKQHPSQLARRKHIVARADDVGGTVAFYDLQKRCKTAEFPLIDAAAHTCRDGWISEDMREFNFIDETGASLTMNIQTGKVTPTEPESPVPIDAVCMGGIRVSLRDTSIVDAKSPNDGRILWTLNFAPGKIDDIEGIGKCVMISGAYPSKKPADSKGDGTPFTHLVAIADGRNLHSEESSAFDRIGNFVWWQTIVNHKFGPAFYIDTEGELVAKPLVIPSSFPDAGPNEIESIDQHHWKLTRWQPPKQIPAWLEKTVSKRGKTFENWFLSLLSDGHENIGIFDPAAPEATLQMHEIELRESGYTSVFDDGRKMVAVDEYSNWDGHAYLRVYSLPLQIRWIKRLCLSLFPVLSFWLILGLLRKPH